MQKKNEGNLAFVLGVGIILALIAGGLGSYAAYNLGYKQAEAELQIKLIAKDKEIAEAKQAAAKAAKSSKKRGKEPPPPVKVSSLGAADLNIPALTALEPASRDLVMSVLNTVVGPCDPCVDAGLSAATCTKAKPICKNMPGLVGRAARLARQGKGKQQLTDALTFDEPWARVVIGKSPIEGPVDAPITVVEYSEFQCPFCRRAQETMKKIEETYHGKVRFVFKHFPLAKHKLAKPAAIASMAAGHQGQFWPYKALLFERQRDLRKDGIFEEIAGELELDQVRWKRDMENPEIEAIIKADVAQAKKLGVRGTPTFFVNGYKLRGAKPFEAFQELIDAELADLKD